jgi:hypothetical protein
MKKRNHKISEDEILKEFPIRGQPPGWYFRCRETSNNAWVVEGSDRWGRRVWRDGADPEKLLAACEVDAATVHQALTKP